MRPARIELATLGLGVPCSIQIELRAHMLMARFYETFAGREVVTLALPAAIAKPKPHFSVASRRSRAARMASSIRATARFLGAGTSGARLR